MSSSLEFRQFEYFVAVAEHLHFGRAAEALSIGQPAVSQQVARLERALGCKLLDRTPRNVRLTPAGQRFLPKARAVLAAVEQAETAALNESDDDDRRLLRIGTCSGLGERLAMMLQALRAQSPGTATELISASTQARLERVAAGQLDAAFVRGVAPRQGMELIQVWADRLMVVLPAGDALAAQEVVDLRDLQLRRLRIVARRLNPPLVDLVLTACADAGFRPRITDSPASLEHLVAAVASGAPSWSVVYESHARMLAQSHVAFRPLVPPLVMTTSLAVRADASSRDIGPLLTACAAADSLP